MALLLTFFSSSSSYLLCYSSKWWKRWTSQSDQMTRPLYPSQPRAPGACVLCVHLLMRMWNHTWHIREVDGLWLHRPQPIQFNILCYSIRMGLLSVWWRAPHHHFATAAAALHSASSARLVVYPLCVSARPRPTAGHIVTSSIHSPLYRF